jgi:hypothetical protein
MFVVALFISSCQKKDLPLDGTVVKERQDMVEGDIKKALQSAEYGFQLFPESATTNTRVTLAAGFTLQFDTTNNQVTMFSALSGYTAPSASSFTLSAATGMPLLVFSTQSYISRIYALGDQGVTDFFFKVMKLSGDTIKVQPYRKGNIYASEGGPVFNMVKIKPSIDIPARSTFDTVNVLLTKLGDNNFVVRNPVKFGAALNIASYNTAVTAELSADLSLIAAYNQKNNTTYEAFPDGTYELTKKQTQIPAGSKYSVDSFEVSLKNMGVFQKGKTYILPVKTSTASPFVQGPKNVAYIVLRLNNVSMENVLLAGITIARNGWSVTASSSFSSNPVARVLDGNNATAWSSTAGIPEWLRLDMAASKTVKGFVLVPSYEYRTENWLLVNVSSSMDGVNWTFEGTYSGSVTATSSSATNPDTKYLNFINPVTARYFKFDILRSTDGTYVGLSEINAIE